MVELNGGAYSLAEPRIVRGANSLIDFVCIGPTRTASSWLHDTLYGVLSLPGPHVKETKFFDLNYHRGANWYRSHLHIVPDTPIGEFGPTYFHSHLARQRLAEFAPECTIIAVLREPVARLFSLYRMRVAFGTIKYSFEDAVHLDPELNASARYAFHLAAWASHFGGERTRVLLYDSLLLDRQRFIDDFCTLCGIPGLQLDPPGLKLRLNESARWSQPRFPLLARVTANTGWKLRFNKLSVFSRTLRRYDLANPFVMRGSSLPELDSETAKRTRTLFEGEIRALENLLKVDLSDWREGRSNQTYLDPVTVDARGATRDWKVLATHRKATPNKVVLVQPLATGGYSMRRYGSNMETALKSASSAEWEVESFHLPLDRGPFKEALPHGMEIVSRYVKYPAAVSRLRADIVHIIDHGYGHLLLGLNKTKTVVTCHDAIPWLTFRGTIPVRISRRVMFSSIARLKQLTKAAHVIVDSQNTKADLEHLMPSLSGRISVVYPGVSKAFSPVTGPEERDESRAALGIAPDETLLLHVGGTIVYKNVQLLPTILNTLKDRVKCIKLIVVGKLSKEFLRNIEMSGLSRHVTRMQNLDEEALVRLYRSSDVFVFPSLYEGFGWPPLEAMACGVPVVSSRAGSLAEVLGEGAILCDPSDAVGFAAAIEKLLTESELRQRQIAAGKRRAARYTWEHTAEQVLEVYRHVLDGSSG
ncbi:MAG: glycosyltransferase family 4 protein [Candidatus Binataceae bacterium]